MTIKEIYEKFDKIGCLSFSTINEDGEPEARIAHLRAFDDDGIYFMTMFTKSFYKQLKAQGTIALSGLCADTKVSHDADGMPVFEGGYAIRMTGTVKEVSIDDIKAKNSPVFDLCIKDHEKYNAMVVFCIDKGRGDIFDYDFELVNRDHKLERIYFNYNGAENKYRGLKIKQDECLHCGLCKQKCSFKAVLEENGAFKIDENRCDECGDCFINCPFEAIALKD